MPKTIRIERLFAAAIRIALRSSVRMEGIRSALGTRARHSFATLIIIKPKRRAVALQNVLKTQTYADTVNATAHNVNTSELLELSGKQQTSLAYITGTIKRSASTIMTSAAIMMLQKRPRMNARAVSHSPLMFRVAMVINPNSRARGIVNMKEIIAEFQKALRGFRASGMKP